MTDKHLKELEERSEAIAVRAEARSGGVGLAEAARWCAFTAPQAYHSNPKVALQEIERVLRSALSRHESEWEVVAELVWAGVRMATGVRGRGADSIHGDSSFEWYEGIEHDGADEFRAALSRCRELSIGSDTALDGRERQGEE